METVFILLTVISLSFGATVKNKIVGEPEIECHSDHVLVNFNTENPFEGHVYVKGQYGTAGCRTDATNSRAATISVPFAGCGVRRQRSLNPDGLFVITTVVVSFHPQFLTMVDRAYHVKCFYMEVDKTVTSNLGVSMITTQRTLTQSIPMPACRYQVLQGNVNGSPVRFAKIGDSVYHKWSCDTDTVDIFCMTVHSCFVDDGQGTQVQILDENGCAQDKYLLENVDYTGDLSGGRGTMVFKFADKPTLFFNCQIRLTLKADGKCSRTSESCTLPVRGRRSIEYRKNTNDTAGPSIDVYTDEITVFSDINTPDPAIDINKLIQTGKFCLEEEFNREISLENAPQIFTELAKERRVDSSVCVSKVVFAVLVACIALVTLSFSVAISTWCMRTARKDKIGGVMTK